METVLREIKRHTGKRYNAEEKIHIVHEGINNMRTVDVYDGKSKEIVTMRSRIKLQNLNYALNS